ncbi:epimerase [Vallitalea longa]|uniref:UDP-glucose 4-epimerase n=1 Tax=Vallitalea longa TaxID=2936439 RepID=A0A9W5YC35_9FIRM|nr:NAD-dependent epimerase/dehydratase family protein [Vallitalea longa]GKX30747.1 epimerase [Vallitalea longa]
MKILVLGGTRFFGVHMVNALIKNGHDVTIATRGLTKDNFGEKVDRIIIERTSSDSMAKAFGSKHYDVVCDNLAYCSNDVKYLLDNIECNRYVMTSSASVYDNLHMGITESEYDPYTYGLKWCSRNDYIYPEIKRQAECALFRAYPHVQAVAVRFPYVIGQDDYTERLYFYVNSIVNGIPMNINGLDEQIPFVKSSEAGQFIAWIAERDFTGPINGNNVGTITLHEIIDYVERKTNKKAIYSLEGAEGPYNGVESFDLDTKYAKDSGHRFTELDEWIYKLMDCYIQKSGQA